MATFLSTYGTLRLNKSHPMANYLSINSKLVGLGILSKAKLYTNNEFPALIETSDETNEVIGDVFELDAHFDWKILDDYEGIGIGEPPYEYRRVQRVTIYENKPIECWVYFYNHPLSINAQLIESGDFLNP